MDPISKGLAAISLNGDAVVEEDRLHTISQNLRAAVTPG